MPASSAKLGPWTTIEFPIRDERKLAGLALADERIGKEHVDAAIERMLLAAMEPRKVVVARHYSEIETPSGILSAWRPSDPA